MSWCARREGAQTAGSIAEAGRQAGREWSDYVAPAIAAGLGTAAIGMVSGKIGQKLGIGDLETDVAVRAAGVKGAGAGTGGFLSRIGKEFIKEGALEEMTQSAQEQAFQNIATGRPIGEGVEQAAASGLICAARALHARCMRSFSSGLAHRCSATPEYLRRLRAVHPSRVTRVRAARQPHATRRAGQAHAALARRMPG